MNERLEDGDNAGFLLSFVASTHTRGNTPEEKMGRQRGRGEDGNEEDNVMEEEDWKNWWWRREYAEAEGDTCKQQETKQQS